MTNTPHVHSPVPVTRNAQSGFSLIELMVSITISLLILLALIAVFLNFSRNNKELAKTNSQIENGRFAIQLLQNDLVHAGFWGGYVPEFDDVTWQFVPYDAPSAVPAPCLSYASWDFSYKNNLLGIPVQGYDAVPSGCSGVVTNKMTNSDVMVVRHASSCVAGAAGCDADVTGKLYFQSSFCGDGTAGTAQGGTATSITLAAPSATSTTSRINNLYSGMTIRIISGTGAGQSNQISTYAGTTYIATVTTPWTTNPDSTSVYAIAQNVLDTTGFSLHQKGSDCATAVSAAKRKFISNIYYIRDYARSTGDGIPTLVRSAFDPGTTVALAHQSAEALIEGVESFRVELAIDDTVTRCSPSSLVDYSAAINKVDPALCSVNADPTLNTLPTNRGDGIPDSFIHCTSATPCTAAQLANVVAVKLFVLARTQEPTSGYTDTKSYCLATRNLDGSCPAAGIITPGANDHYKRHVFSTMVRLANISGRRETR
jgi:prepilin-type N-terminal cleavage/methylation domain-containing protein